jgi:hypothetical protein
MSVYLPPILHNNQLNSTFNSNDFNYQFESINYVKGDKRYTKKTDYNTKTGVIDSSFNLLENKTTNMTYSTTTGTTFNNNINVNSLNNISSTNLSFLSGLSSNIEASIQNINQKLTGYGYNPLNGYSDFTNPVSIYGNFSFTGTINNIAREKFMYACQNLTSDAQAQLTALVNSINTTNSNLATTNTNLTTTNSNLATTNTNLATTNSNLATTNTNLATNYVDKNNTQIITGTKSFSTVNVTNLYATNVFSTNVPIYYNSNTTISTSLSNVYVNLTSGCTTITMPSIDINEGQTLILSNLTSNSITVNCPSGSSFIGPLYVFDGTNTFSIPKSGRAVICNKGSFGILFI